MTKTAVPWTRAEDQFLRAQVREASDDHHQIRDERTWTTIAKRVSEKAGTPRTVKAVRFRAVKKRMVKPLRHYRGRAAAQAAVANGTAPSANPSGLLSDVLRRLVAEELIQNASVKAAIEAEVRHQLEELLR
jgi:hypothetical protein